MTDRCEKCGREKADVLNADHHVDGRDRCWRENALSCQVTAGYRRGLREGVELAKVYTHAEADVDALGRAVGWVSWDGVDAELVRRTDG